MRRQSKFDKIFKRDEILRSQISIAGFVAFGVSILFWPITIISEFLNKEITFIVAKYALSLVGLNLLVFLGALFILTIAKKEFWLSEYGRKIDAGLQRVRKQTA